MEFVWSHFSEQSMAAIIAASMVEFTVMTSSVTKSIAEIQIDTPYQIGYNKQMRGNNIDKNIYSDNRVLKELG